MALVSAMKLWIAEFLDRAENAALEAPLHEDENKLRQHALGNLADH
jgi:hypothetical protein